MKITALSVLLIIIYSCSAKSSVKTEPQKAPLSDSKVRTADSILQFTEAVTAEKQVHKNSNLSLGKRILISSGQFYPCDTRKINGCIFDLAINDNDTIYMATKDVQFKTPEGFKKGTKFSELPQSIQSAFTKETGWGYYHELQSGWCLAFCEGSSCTDSYPTSKSEVKWIFKRN